MNGSTIFSQRRQGDRQRRPRESENKTTHQEHRLRTTAVPRELQPDCIQAVSSGGKTHLLPLNCILRILLQLYVREERWCLLLNEVGHCILSYKKKNRIGLYNAFSTLIQMLLSDFVTYSTLLYGSQYWIMISPKPTLYTARCFHHYLAKPSRYMQMPANQI